MEVKSGKAFADFIIALNDDVKALYTEKQEDLKPEDTENLLKEAWKDSIQKLMEASKQGITFHGSLFHLVMSVVFNYLHFDNSQVSNMKNYEILIHRYDAVWSYFKQLVDSFSLLESIASEKDKQQSS